MQREELQSRYQEIKGVSSVDVYGITDSVISVNIDDKKLAENQISLQTVMGILNAQNTAVTVGEKTIDGKTSNIKVIGDLTSIEKLKGLIVAPNVTLGDIATIDETRDTNFISRFNGKDCLDKLKILGIVTLFTFNILLTPITYVLPHLFPVSMYHG